jgi:hypothetical protein
MVDWLLLLAVGVAVRVHLLDGIVTDRGLARVDATAGHQIVCDAAYSIEWVCVFEELWSCCPDGVTHH